MCACVSVCLCVPLVNDSSETIEVTHGIVKLGTVTASDMRMHHVLIMLTLTFIQGHTDLDHGNKCSIISKTVLAMPIKFALKIVRLKVYIIGSQSDDLALHPRSQVRLKLDKRCTIIVISRRAFTLWHSNVA